MSVVDDMLALEQQLKAAGLAAVSDPAKVNPPCVVVEPPALEPGVEATLCGQVRAVWRVVIVGEGRGDAATIAQLYAALPKVVDVLDVDWTVTHATPGPYRPAPTADALPALIVTAEGVTTL